MDPHTCENLSTYCGGVKTKPAMPLSVNFCHCLVLITMRHINVNKINLHNIYIEYLITIHHEIAFTKQTGYIDIGIMLAYCL